MVYTTGLGRERHFSSIQRYRNLNDEIRNQNSDRLGLNMKLDSTYIVSLAYSDFFFYFLQQMQRV